MIVVSVPQSHLIDDIVNGCLAEVIALDICVGMTVNDGIRVKNVCLCRMKSATGPSIVLGELTE